MEFIEYGEEEWPEDEKDRVVLRIDREMVNYISRIMPVKGYGPRQRSEFFCEELIKEFWHYERDAEQQRFESFKSNVEKSKKTRTAEIRVPQFEMEMLEDLCEVYNMNKSQALTFILNTYRKYQEERFDNVFDDT